MPKLMGEKICLVFGSKALFYGDQFGSRALESERLFAFAYSDYLSIFSFCSQNVVKWVIFRDDKKMRNRKTA